ncbi:hypothetical protein DYE48_02370 [Halobacillus trueperi]|uniref:Uncharacterized protein n=1 Tax=Halobacillus trueperi TaxID=156205 RepID=A0A3E0JEQ5_9BACI|nr:hypothetical protein DYE48_02370 [Halobacillus trueperi]
MLGETPQDAIRGGSPRSRGKRAIPRSPHPLNKSLETESSTKGSFSGSSFIIMEVPYVEWGLM